MNNLIRKNFTITPNALINDESLHPVARFMFVYLASKPEDWQWRVTKIQKDLQISKPTRLKYMGELINAGWISTEQAKGEDGEFGNMNIVLHAEPQPKNFTAAGSPRATFTAAEKNGGGKSLPLNNTEEINNTDSSKKTKDAKAEKPAEDLFGKAPNPSKKTTFENSAYFPLAIFKNKLDNLDAAAGIDLEYYHRAVNNWSQAKTVKRTAKGWIATARTFMEKDKDAGKLKMIKSQAAAKKQDAEMLEYLNM